MCKMVEQVKETAAAFHWVEFDVQDGRANEGDCCCFLLGGVW